MIDSRRVAETYPLFITNEDDLLSQMDATAPGVQHRSLLFNHWRTAENRTSIRYAAEATLMGGRHREEFYRDYASHLCVKDAEAFLVLVRGEAILSGCGYGDTSLIAVVDCTVEVVGHTLPADHITLMGIQVVVWL